MPDDAGAAGSPLKDFLLGLWPLKQIARRMEWRRKDREEIVIATARYTTSIVAGPEHKKTGLQETHVLSFLVDGNGLRYTDWKTTNEDQANRHGTMLADRANWKHHGELPEYAKRVSNGPKGKLVALPGGKTS